MLIKERSRAEFALLGAALIWGLTFPFIRIAIQEVNSFSLILIRSIIASLVFIPFVFLKKEDRISFYKLLPFGFLLGFLAYFSYLFQTFGLETISAGRSAFITNLTVVLVPLFSPLFKRGKPTKYDLISSCIALFGMYFLTSPFSSNGISTGDLWTLLCAICFSIHIHCIQYFVEKFGKSKIFASMQIIFMALFSALMLPIFSKTSNILPTSLLVYGAIFYLGAIAMVGTTLIQARFQYKTTPERASIIFILEPVFAIFFGYVILHESMSPKALFGAFLMVLAVVWVYFFQIGRNFLKTN